MTGNLGQEPELKFNNQSGKATLNLSIAATPSRLDRQTNQWSDVGEPLWIRATLWEQMAERLADVLHKGDRVSVEGTFSIRTYQAQDGSQRLSYELLGAKFLGVVPRAPQNAAQPFAGQPNSPTGGYSDTPATNGPQNGTYDVFGNAGGGSFNEPAPF
ncbi:single-stranded DNA-binding protein [Scrofimicrobium canadense]|uniref:single-stranded DNA-binding protein n=1 Tax=Scrofimicrobium canadense TaxID=2652290 RepID=UPI0019824EAF|nr:single-stranded DNA-binding protein [Scrofimicrobium canadense]